MAKNAVIISVAASKIGQKAAYGEEIYWGQHLHNNGYVVEIIQCSPFSSTNISDNFVKNKNSFSVAIILMSQVEILDGDNLNRVLWQIQKLKSRYNFNCTIATGSIATAISSHLLKSGSGIDCVINQLTILKKSNSSSFDELYIIQRYYKSIISLTCEFITDTKMTTFKDETFPLYTSIGCNQACWFCSYCMHTPIRIEKPLNEVALDIINVNKTLKCTKFTLIDNNFGSNAIACEARVDDLLKYMAKLPGDIELYMNVSSVNLTPNVIFKFKKAHIKAILIGLENLDESILIKYFNKRQSINKFCQLLKIIDNIGITAIISYIMFHPWLTYESLCWQIKKIDSLLGRYRIIQFMANSKLRVVPGTKLERVLQKDGLLIEDDVNPKIVFRDKKVYRIYQKLNRFYRKLPMHKYHACKELPTRDIISMCKRKEWDYLKKIVGDKYV